MIQDQYTSQIDNLVKDHLSLTDEPLLCAVRYIPDDAPKKVFLLEVIENFGRNAVDPNHELFEVEYAPSEAFPMGKDERLHVVLTNPIELEHAVKEGWDTFRDIANAVKKKRYDIVYQSENAAGKQIVSLLEFKTTA